MPLSSTRHLLGGNDTFQSPGREETVIYELHIGTFYDEPGSGPGNIAGAIVKLGYLRDLGITHIEIMPSMEFSTDFS